MGYVLAALAAACWATGGLTAKWLFTSEGPQTAAWAVPPSGVIVDPIVLSGARAFSAFLVLLVYLALSKRHAFKITLHDLPFLAVFGVVGLAGMHFTYFKAISYTNVATAILLEYLAPVLVLIVSVLFLGERLTWALPSGVALSVLGCSLVVGAIGGEGLTVSAQGIMWGLVSAAFFAGYSLMGRYAAPRFSPWTALVYGLGFAAAFWLIYLGGPSGIATAFASPSSTAAVLFIAVVSTIVPFAAFLKALHYIDPTRATIIATLEPVSAGVAAFAAFGETFGAVQLVGALLVLAAIVVIQAPGTAAESHSFEVPPAS
jgi:drug/metabolite transporter (DMT)-like permease